MDTQRTGATGFLAGLREFAYGMTGHEFARHALATRASLETVFLGVTMGDMIGLPIIPPYYSLRLLPYAIPSIMSWKRRALRPVDALSRDDFELHGM